MRRFCLAALLALGLTSALAPVQAQAQDEEENYIRLSARPEGWKVEQLFENVSAQTGRSILFESKNQTIKNANVNFVGDAIIPESRLFDWLQAVLAYQKLVLVPVGPPNRDGESQWYAMDQANPNLTSRPVYIAEDDVEDYADRDGLYVVTSFSLKNISDTNRVRNALSPLLTKTAGIGRLNDIPGTRSLIVGDFAPIVAAMKRLLLYIDVENVQITPQMEVIQLQHAVARELEPILTDLIQRSLPTQQTGGGRNRNATAPNEEPEPRIIADDRLDALIIYATESHRKKIKELIDQLDIPNQNYRQRIHFRPLKHSDSEEMAALLEDLISGTSGSSSSTRTTSSSTGRRNTGSSVNQGQPGAFGGGIEGDPVIIADTRSNSLIIHASPTQFGDIDTLIERLDRARPQVLIESALVELSLTDRISLGVELFSSSNDILVDTDGDGVGDTITDEQSYFAGTSTGLTDIATTAIDGIEVPIGRSPTVAGALNVGIFKNGRLPFLLSAFQSSQSSKVLTMPSVVTNDNNEATIELTETTSTRVSVSTDTGTDRDSFEPVDARTILTVSPHISSDNYLRLEIDQQIEDFKPTDTSAGQPPDRTTRAINTIVTLPDRYTVVLGGLIKNAESSTVTKVPFLGDIPILGFLFRTTSDENRPSHIFLFVTPRILRHTETFGEVHKLTWERKLLADDLFRGDIDFPGSNFKGNRETESPDEQADRILRSGDLDGTRLKAPRGLEERRAEAKRNYLEKQKGSSDTPQDGGEK